MRAIMIALMFTLVIVTQTSDRTYTVSDGSSSSVVVVS